MIIEIKKSLLLNCHTYIPTQTCTRYPLMEQVLHTISLYNFNHKCSNKRKKKQYKNDSSLNKQGTHIQQSQRQTNDTSKSVKM